MKHMCSVHVHNAISFVIRTPLDQSVERQDFNLVVVRSFPKWGVTVPCKMV